jgi:hypothetical protein
MWQMERKEFQQTTEILKREMQTSREELSMFQKDKCENQNTPSKEQVMEYHTDEEELSRETEWISKKNKKTNCLTANVTATDGTTPTTERAEKDKTSANNSWKRPELPENV